MGIVSRRTRRERKRLKREIRRLPASGRRSRLKKQLRGLREATLERGKILPFGKEQRISPQVAEKLVTKKARTVKEAKKQVAFETRVAIRAAVRNEQKRLQQKSPIMREKLQRVSPLLERSAAREFEKNPRAQKVKVTINGVTAEFVRGKRQLGTLEIARKPKTISEKLARAKSIQLQKIQKRGGAVQRIFRGVAILGLLGAARGVLGVVSTVTKPVQFVKGQIQAIKHPVETVKILGDQFTVDPVGTVIEFLTYGKALNLASRGVKRSSVGRFLHEESFIAKQPSQVRPAVRKILKASKIQEKINPTNVPSISKADFMKVKSLTKIEAKALIKALNKNDVIFGSLAARITGGKRFKSKLKIPKDVDLATKNVSDFNSRFINALPKELRKGYVIKKQQIKRISNRETLMDVKPLSRLIPERSIISKKGLLPVSGYVRRLTRKKGSILPTIKRKAITGAFEVPTQKIVKVKLGKKVIKVVGFGEQTVRKGLGTLQVLIEKNVKRAKDPQSFLVMLEIQKAALKLKKSSLFIRRKIRILDSAIKLLKSKGFSKLLDQKVPGLTKEFPLVAKISSTKLRKINLKVVRKRVKVGVKKLAKPEISVKEKKIVTGKKPSRLPKRKPSRLPSKLPKKRPSRLPSKVPRKRPSKLPSKIPKKKRPSKLPSKIPKKKPSKLPSKIPTKKRPSRLPSRLPRKVPSKLPKRKISKFPKTLFKIQIKKKIKKLKKKKLRKIKDEQFVFLADLVSAIEGFKSSPAEKKAFLEVGKIFTGLERRKLI